MSDRTVGELITSDSAKTTRSGGRPVQQILRNTHIIPESMEFFIQEDYMFVNGRS